ncbi:hypothetical protein D3C76_701440 [compost metagenome]
MYSKTGKERLLSLRLIDFSTKQESVTLVTSSRRFSNGTRSGVVGRTKECESYTCYRIARKIYQLTVISPYLEKVEVKNLREH